MAMEKTGREEWKGMHEERKKEKKRGGKEKRSGSGFEPPVGSRRTLMKTAASFISVCQRRRHSDVGSTCQRRHRRRCGALPAICR